MERENPSIAPVDLGSMGYDGEESLYVSDPVRQAAFEEFGLALDFYKAYNTSHHNPKKYFDSVSDINISEVAWCNTTEFTNPERISLYLQYSGDYAGAVQVDETYVAKCEDGHWWRAPACRHDWSACIPLVTGGAGWRLQALMSWAAAYGIPAAVGVSNSWGNYVKHVTQVRSLFYWWLPDSTFIDMNPSEVVFPRHSARAWEQGDKRTGAKGSYVSKIVSNNLQAKSRLVHGFVKNINFELPEVQRMLADYETLGAKEAACNWVKENPAIWRSWVPIDTNCGAGFGVVDGHGAFLGNRTGAAKCGLCPAGRASEEVFDNLGKTHRCLQAVPTRLLPGQHLLNDLRALSEGYQQRCPGQHGVPALCGGLLPR
ncbi:unnamed protein product [Effrenium voratum]|nr:unnamed protein product [Effrenium voratum]